MNVDQHLAKRIRELRQARGLTLEQLAELSGVSRSMISLIEREETSPTAAVLNKLADALSVSLAGLFADESRDVADTPLARLAQQPVWTDPGSGYVRRHVSPSGPASPVELVEVSFPPGQRVTFDSPTRNVVTHQLVWMLEGQMEVAVAGTAWRLQPGDCLAMVLGPQTIFRNPTRKPARYAVVLTTTVPHRRSA